MRLNEQQQPTAPQQGFGRLDLYVAAFLGTVALIAGVALTINFWPWFPIVLLLIGAILGGLRMWMVWEHHRVDIDIKKNRVRAGVFHETDQGFGYVQEDNTVAGYSHVNQMGMGMPPFDPALLGMGEPAEPRAKYPKTFKEMLDGGYIAPGADLVVAFDQGNGEPIKLPNPTSTGMSGLPGAGKTVTTSLLMMEMIAKWNGRVRFLVVDPHMEVEGDESLLSKIEPLSPYFLTQDEVASTVPEDDRTYRNLLDLYADLSSVVSGGAELGAWMEIVALEMERRKHGKTGDVWVIVIDEFAAVMDSPQAKLISKVIAAINREARKMGMYALVISQDWKASTAGGTDIRQSIPAFIIHNTASQVVGLFAPQDIAREAEKLDVGQVIVRTRGKSSKGSVPMVTEYDAQKLMELYPPVTNRVRISEVKSEKGKSSGPLLDGGVPVDASFSEVSQSGRLIAEHAEGVPVGVSTEQLNQIRDLYTRGLEVSDIAKRVYQVRSGPDLAEAKLRVRGVVGWMVANASVSQA